MLFAIYKVYKSDMPLEAEGGKKYGFLGSLFGDDLGAYLIKAAKAGDTEKMKRLLAEGADINAKTEDGVTALIAASLNGHAEIVNALIDKGADVNAKDKDGETA